LLLWLLLPWYGVLVAAAVLVLWLTLARRGRQALLVTRMGLATLSSRWGSSSVVVVGIAGVVGVLVSLFAMAQGLEATLQLCGNDTTVMVMHQWAISESTSVLGHDTALRVQQMPGVARDGGDRPIASPELVVMASLQEKAALKADPSLKVAAQTTEAYYADQAADQSVAIHILGTAAAIIMGLGALFGALNSMHAAVTTRLREIAILRALGFRGTPVVTSVMLEAMLLALGGGVLGALMAYAIFGHFTASAMGGGFTQVVFEFRIAPALLWKGIKWALAIGFVGAALPAIRSATIPVASAIREL
jgi:FtsX-like permease family